MVWLNIGCGPFPAPEPWVNIDRNTDPYPADFSQGTGSLPRTPHVVAPCWDLPFPTGSVGRVYVGHLLEHLNLYNGELFRSLAEIRRVLAPNGFALFVGPDSVKTAERIAVGARTWTDFWGGHGTAGRGNENGPTYAGRPGDVHQWTSTTEAMYLACKLGFPGAAVEPMAIDAIGDNWPIVSRIWDQAAVMVIPGLQPARAP